MIGRLLGHALPPDITIVGQSTVRENRVYRTRGHGIALVCTEVPGMLIPPFLLKQRLQEKRIAKTLRQLLVLKTFEFSMSTIPAIISQYLPEIIDFRHDLHRYPEIGYEERETSSKIANRLEAVGQFEIETGIAKTGIVATLGAEKPGPCIALRADMDCLPIVEKSGKPWASQNHGYMHACGHDGHTSCLLGTALTLSEISDSIKGPVKFLFQPAEEGGAGGEKMVNAGVLADPEVAMIFGLHGWPGLPLGEIATRAGPIMANADEFEITVYGKGGHAAYPHVCIDPILIASNLVTALQSITSRNVPSQEEAVVTVAKFEGGSAFNIIPEQVTLLGTVRTMTEKTQELVFEQLTSISNGIAESMGGRAEIRIKKGYPVLVNDAKAVDYLKEQISKIPQSVKRIHQMPAQMVGEDFAFFAKEIPACFFALGLRPPGEETYPQLHQSDFDFNDDALPIGIRCFSELVMNF